MKRLTLLLALAALGGCENETVKRVETFAREACACPDAPCAEKVEARYLALVKEGQKRGSLDDRKKIEKAYGKMRECIARARQTGAAAPDAESGSPSPNPAP